MDALTASLLCAAGGVVVGVTGARLWRRPPSVPAAPAETAVPVEALPDGAVAVLGALGAASVVLDAGEAVVWASPAAATWGMVEGGRLTSDDIVRAVRAARAEADVRSLEIEPRRRRGAPRTLMMIRVVPLTSELVVVLAEDRSALARVDDVRRDFVANVSHELKTPVGALSLLAEAVEGASDDPEAVLRFAARMQHEAARLSAMVNELIELSRLQGDDPMIDAVPVLVDDVIADGADFVRTAAAAKSIDLRVTGDHGLVVTGVRKQLTTALRNLLDNAVNYSAERTRVVVTVHAVADMVEVSVADQGIGISETDQHRIFERFYRVDPARSRETGGTGLGLSIVRHVCLNHGGDVAVWSVEGSGSTFTLRLPAAEPHERALVARPAEEQPAVRPLAEDADADRPGTALPVGEQPMRRVVP